MLEQYSQLSETTQNIVIEKCVENTINSMISIIENNMQTSQLIKALNDSNNSIHNSYTNQSQARDKNMSKMLDTINNNIQNSQDNLLQQINNKIDAKHNLSNQKLVKFENELTNHYQSLSHQTVSQCIQGMYTYTEMLQSDWLDIYFCLFDFYCLLMLF